MENLFEAVSELIRKLVAITVSGGAIFLLAGELRLATLKKAIQGSTKLSSFTERMTKSHKK